MQILEPVLIKGTAEISPNDGGARLEIPFDFAHMQGGLILKVEWSVRPVGISGIVNAGLGLNANRVVPAAVGSLIEDELVFAFVQVVEAFTSSGYGTTVDPVSAYPLVEGIAIAANLVLLAFSSTANARPVGCKIYYKRVVFSAAEVGSVLILRR